MHSYSIDSDIRTKITVYIVIISILIMFIMSILLDSLGFKFIPLNIMVSTIFPIGLKMFTTAIFIFGVLYRLFDKKLWKNKLILKYHGIPDLNGVWVGEYKSSYKSHENMRETRGEVCINIQQTWSKISIKSNNEESTSHSELAGIFMNSVKGVELRFEHHNEAEKTINENMKKHTGFTSLVYDNASNNLEGSYYNDKNRRTFGILKYSRQELANAN